jgi:7,8-dihydropterin-6-yl-methyl-4-(beta-D-ribofuranosyl)aminobenzene 5'-phosphate synthase
MSQARDTIMNLRITILSENSTEVPFGVTSEHGFSAFVETGHGNFLFDTGQGKVLLQNSTLLGKDLRSIRFLVLSHGHFDHTLGMPEVLAITGELDVYGHPDIFLDRYWNHKNGKRQSIGLPYCRSYLESLGARFQLRKEFTKILDNVFLSGEIPRETDFEKPDQDMVIRGDEGDWVQDPIRDDLSLVMETPKGLVILLGCAHAGMINIIEYAKRKTGKEKIHAVLGGTHLKFSGPGQLERSIEVLKSYDIDLIGASHCTGLKAGAYLFCAMKEKVFFATAGAVLEV